jgi:hypothetical protein
MGYTADAKQLVVGSEPFDTTGVDWRPIGNGTYLFAHVAHGLVAAKAGAIPNVEPVRVSRPAR